jgi:hypothetical protein
MIVPEFETGFKDAVPTDSIEGAICVEALKRRMKSA